ncbi:MULTISPECIES: CTP synthase [Kitasatospora]|uniref:CTP synthase (glutamine hydrolyzing) n=1 Tax=Kitasatospora setae (strain ATCC 33774 / DSM 43861 / JCM 3304 / KCC A-0304 / NBRC 14216 / KM-6054) TaxID=452652 RepID=E4N7H1_KITSK|nr:MULTISPECIES: CTP synthase [Kitasatospora]BAJ27152.1 putative CTP synthase family protein [Kitasatospora setae KM-6054]
MDTAHTPRVALVGDRSPHVPAHRGGPRMLAALADADGPAVEPYWIGTDEVDPDELAGFDGIWLVPGSPYRSEAGAVAAARTARERGVPFLGTCGGFQHAVLEFARHACGIGGAAHAEQQPEAEELLIVPLTCSLYRQEGGIRLLPGSTAARLLGTERVTARYNCGYTLAQEYLEVLRAHGMRFTGHDLDGELRVAELPSHPFWLASLFQPELTPEHEGPHPFVRAFAEAATARAAARATAR